MAKKKYSRRDFLKRNSFTGLGAVVAMGVTPSLFAEEVGNLLIQHFPLLDAKTWAEVPASMVSTGYLLIHEGARSHPGRKSIQF
jgi:hypothetical protein